MRPGPGLHKDGEVPNRSLARPTGESAQLIGRCACAIPSLVKTESCTTTSPNVTQRTDVATPTRLRPGPCVDPKRLAPQGPLLRCKPTSLCRLCLCDFVRPTHSSPLLQHVEQFRRQPRARMLSGSTGLGPAGPGKAQGLADHL